MILKHGDSFKWGHTYIETKEEKDSPFFPYLQMWKNITGKFSTEISFYF